jgi:arsenate reductase (glutaredoxin)
MIRIYGIKACDTCRKALKWLEAEGKAHQWQDIREQPLDEATVSRWLKAVGPETLVNRRSTTWRQMDEASRAAAMDPAESAGVLLAHPTLIKRPVFEREAELMVGFNAAVREAL